jgi:hypothetical protein
VFVPSSASSDANTGKGHDEAIISLFDAMRQLLGPTGSDHGRKIGFSLGEMDRQEPLLPAARLVRRAGSLELDLICGELRP